jgi:prolipoprotein diacylglyceryltransferase
MQPFSVLLGIGALLGLLLAGWRAPQKETIRYMDAEVLVLLLVLAGSRVGFVVVNGSYYAGHLGEIFQVWLGGLSSIGALAGAVIGIPIVSAWFRLPVGLLADISLPLASSLAITSWLGCWAGMCAYGAQSNAWWALPGRDEWGVVAARLPVQLMGAVLTLVLLILLEWLGKRWPPGLSATLGLFGLSAIVFGLSYLRVDPVPVWRGWRLEAWGAAVLMAISAGIVVVLLVQWRLRPRPARSRRVT